MDNFITAFIGGSVIIVISVVGATWHLSDKIGDLRVAIASLPCRPTQDEHRERRAPRRCRMPAEPVQE